MNSEETKLDEIKVTPYARATEFHPIVRVLPKISRNSYCPIKNLKFKKCCGASGQDYCTSAKDNLEKYLNDLKNAKKS